MKTMARIFLSLSLSPSLSLSVFLAGAVCSVVTRPRIILVALYVYFIINIPKVNIKYLK